MKQITLKGLFENNRFSRIFALFLAFFCWMVVIMTSQDTRTRTVENVPVDIGLLASDLKNLGLDPIENEEYKVSVDVRGQTTVVAMLTPDQLLTTVRVTGITEPGWYDLPLVPAIQSNDYEIVGYTPNTIKVRFDRMNDIALDIKPITTGVSAPEGYALDEIYTTPSRVTVTGPQTELNKISACVVGTEFSEPLTRTYAVEHPIRLLDVQGEEIDLDKSHLTLDVLDAQLVVPVLRIKGLPFNVGFVNIPMGFPLDDLRERMSLTEDSVTVAGPVSLVDGYNELRLGYINIKDITPDSSVYSFEVTLPSQQFRNLDNINSVAVTFDTTGWDIEYFNLTNFELFNEPPDYNIRLLTTALNGIPFVGDKETLAGMTAGDIVVELDFSEKEIAIGQTSFPVKISAPAKGLVWSVGDHSVFIQVTGK